MVPVWALVRTRCTTARTVVCKKGLFFNRDDLHRAEIHRIAGTIFHFCRWHTFRNVPVQPEFLDDLAERVFLVLFK